jgi:RNA polymerase sigma-70 factor (ECF subfamily)
MIYAFEHDQFEDHSKPTPDGEAADEQLMAAIQRQDQTALATLFRRHAVLLRSIINRVIHNDSDTDDLLQEILCEVWEQASHYSQEKGKALGWLVTLARRRAIDRLRRQQAYHRAEERLRAEKKAAPVVAQQGADQEAIASDRSEILRNVIEALPEAQREALILAFYHGMSQREIAAHTGVPLGTIKTRLELAVRKIRVAILALGGVAEWAPSNS